jgi:mono/diheme cytochrome c family protein
MKALAPVVLALACLGLGEPAFSADEATIQQGEKVYTYWCATCHSPGALPGTVALETKYKGAKPALLSERTDLIPAVTKTFVRHGVSIMPFFRKTEITDADLDALAAYLARNNKAPSR